MNVGNEGECRIDLVILNNPRLGDTGVEMLQGTVEVRTATTEKLLKTVASLVN